MYMVILMTKVEFTKASSKGQVVIPQAIREKLGIEEGTPFAVWSKGDEILMKKVIMPTKKTWEQTTGIFRDVGKEQRVTVEDILSAIQKARALRR